MNQELYFNYLCNLVCDTQSRKKEKYYDLLCLLFETEFIFSKKLDRNRAIDGEDLRYRFEKEVGLIPFEEPFKRRCNVLEMMVALSLRIQSTYMDNPVDGDQTSRWFWEMIFSLGLSGMTNDRFNYELVDAKLMRFLTCNYDYDGKGGLFTIIDPDIPVYEMEIWTQADIWVEQNFY